MIEPKTFYRKLDYLLANIGREKRSHDFLRFVLDKIETTFGEDLRIVNGRIYKENGTGFELAYIEESNLHGLVSEKLDGESEAITLLLKSRTYIYDHEHLGKSLRINYDGEYSIPAAFTVANPEERWIFVFDLRSGWVREEIEFCFNAVRRAINYRLFSEAVKSEMEQAARIQQSLLPAAPPPIEGYDIAANSQPAELVGGDMYDYFKFDGNNFGIAVGDASGHGLPAALMVRDVVTGLRMGVEKHMKLVYTLSKLNQVIFRGTYATSFISLFYSEIEDNGSMFYSNAGHPAPLIFNGKTFTELEATSLILGAFSDIEIKRGYAQLHKGDVLVLYTDGIIERQNPDREFFGIERLKEIIRQSYNSSSRQIMDKIFDEAFAFGEKKLWEDDATIMVIKRTA